MTERIIKTDEEIIKDICTFYDVLNAIDTEETVIHNRYCDLFMMFDIRIEAYAFYVSDAIEDTCKNCIVSQYRNSFLTHFVSYLVTSFYRYHLDYETMEVLEEMKDYYVKNLVYLLDTDGEHW